MKLKLRSIILIASAVGVIAGGCVYVARLASHTRVLETRLARVEAALNRQDTKGLRSVTPSMGSASQVAPTPSQTTREFPFVMQQTPFVVQQNSLESRVEKIEQELTPHLELLPPDCSRRA